MAFHPKSRVKPMTNNGGRKRVVDELRLLRYDGIEHYLVEIPKRNAKTVDEKLAKSAFIANAANAVFDYAWFIQYAPSKSLLCRFQYL